MFLKNDMENKKDFNFNIAIVILAYNRYDDFKLTLKSALSQKGILSHIFVFDDAGDRPLNDLINNNPKVTYIRHRKRLGFAGNFRFATEFVKKKGYGMTFLLGDDDMISYSTALADLVSLMNKDKNVHVVRGGFVEFVKKLPNFTRIFTLNSQQCKNIECLSEPEFAMKQFLGFYSGILFKNDLFEPKFSSFNDLVSPFIAPLIKILTVKKFAFLPDKITIFAKTEHQQLATYIYNERISNFAGADRAFRLNNIDFHFAPSIFELINYKIYSNNAFYIKRYYEQCLRYCKNISALPFIIIYYSPSFVLKITKWISKHIISLQTVEKLSRYHRYLDIYSNL